MALCGERQQTLLTIRAVQRISVLLGLETMIPSLLGMSLREHHWLPLAFVRLSKIGLGWGWRGLQWPEDCLKLWWGGHGAEDAEAWSRRCWAGKEGTGFKWWRLWSLASNIRLSPSKKIKKKKKMREALYLCSPSLWIRTDHIRPFLMEYSRLFVDSTFPAWTLDHISCILLQTLATFLQGAGEG